jgi:hypothetical protein
MHFFAILYLATIASVFASAESEHEPSPEQTSIIFSASESFQKTGVSDITNRFDPKEKTSYYLSDISFLGRYLTESGYKLAFRCRFVRSSPYKKDSITPPRGHSFFVALADDFGYLRHFSIEEDTKITINEGLVYADDVLLCDLRKLISPP